MADPLTTSLSTTPGFTPTTAHSSMESPSDLISTAMRDSKQSGAACDRHGKV